MDNAFFVGRVELLAWVNRLLRLDLDKVEQCANGAVYCQIIDSVYPAKVQMKKVNWLAKVEHEFIPNYKLLQLAFDRLGIERNIEVDKLIRARHQDNLEFLQWLKCFWDSTFVGHEYYPEDRRPQDLTQLPLWAQSCAYAVEDAPRPMVASEDKVKPSGLAPTRARPNPGSFRGNANVDTAKLHEKLAELEATVDGLENERDYYFGKLRDIEILTQTLEDQANPDMTIAQLIQTMQKILYKDDEPDQAQV